ncbi:TRAP transporter small permease protein [Notoacmeibacter marinus]|uniref:TRAP transporter small permease protein n=1 Tax=Notoacmeibacter marinus TaxID=1876515 RepID=A0A231V003_9HYPH|nr:TRAP transporter small permease [Notoacmeibacter marinus]OXT01528.1 TRAP transporter small permease protein [Notoacmeibacter marinus]
MSRWIERLAKTSAMVGGIVLVLLTIMTCISIIGRAGLSVGLKPVKGDFELIEAGVALAIFAFLPWCQLRRAHAMVDLFTARLPAQINRWIDLVSEIVMTVALIVITWRLYHGLTDKLRYGETTFILQFPVWWGYAAAFVPAVIACIVSIYMVFVRIGELSDKRPIETGGTIH